MTHTHNYTLTHTHPTHTHTLVSPSAGVGRSGTFIAIDVALQQAEGEGTVDIPSVLTKLRNQRMKMVQTLVSCYVYRLNNHIIINIITSLIINN